VEQLGRGCIGLHKILGLLFNYRDNLLLPSRGLGMELGDYGGMLDREWRRELVDLEHRLPVVSVTNRLNDTY
jgi:hypothetical protein